MGPESGGGPCASTGLKRARRKGFTKEVQRPAEELRKGPWHRTACNGARPPQSSLDLAEFSAILRGLPYQQRLSRVVEGTGPATPQQPGATAKVL